MRLSPNYHKVIKETFKLVFNGKAIYLFGSRVDDSKKGGDIDLYLILKDEDLKNEELFEKKIKFLSKIKRNIGEQKIDIVFNKDKNRLIEQEAIKWGIRL